MKKIVYLALCLGALASLDSCNPKAKATTVQTTKRYTEHIVKDDYNAFVKAIKFTEPAAKPVRRAAVKALADSRRNWNHDAARLAKAKVRNEVRNVQATKPAAAPAPVQKPAAAPVQKAAMVVKKSFGDNLRDEMRYKMTSNGRDWRIRTTGHKEVWRAVHPKKHAKHSVKLAPKEAMKFRDNRKRDFLKDNERGDRRFVKDILRRHGNEEVVKTLQHGKRQRDVVKAMGGSKGRRNVDKLKANGNRLIDEKVIDRRDREIIKAKDNYRGNRERFREVFVK